MKPYAVGALVAIALLAALGALEPADAALCMCHPTSCLLINPDNDDLRHAGMHCPVIHHTISDLMIVRFAEPNFSADSFAFFPNLTALELFQGPLQRLEPGVFDKVPNLHKIVIRNTQLSTIDDHTFRGLNDLEILYIMASALSTIASNAFEGLKKLTHLTLGNNKLAVLPEKLFAPTPALQALSLPGNGISELPAVLFDNLNDLIRLDLSNNLLTSFEFPRLKVTALTIHNNSLHSLYLGDHLTILQADQNRITKLNGSGAKLVNLFLSENKIMDITPITRLTNITKLTLSHNPLQSDSVFSALTRLEELLLSDTHIEISEKTFANMAELKLLDLSYNNLTDVDFSMFSSLVELRTLVVAFNQIQEINFVEQREYLPKLRVLEICGNGWNATYLHSVLQHMHRYRLRADLQGLSHTLFFASTYVELCSAPPETSEKTPMDDVFYLDDLSDLMDQDIDDLMASTTAKITSTAGTTVTTTHSPTTAPMTTTTATYLPAQTSASLHEVDIVEPVVSPLPTEKQPVVGSSPLYVTFQMLVYLFSIFGVICTAGAAYYIRQRRFNIGRVTSFETPDSVRLV